LLAAGYFGFGTVSCFLAAYSAIQITWYSGGWGFGFTKKHYHAARQIATAVVPGTSKIPPWLKYAAFANAGIPHSNLIRTVNLNGRGKMHRISQFRQHQSYSVLRLFIGLAKADLIAWKLIVNTAINRTNTLFNDSF
jgi:hypothetical protein